MMSHKKAVKWITEHPEVDPVMFWFERSEQLRRSSMRWLNVAIIALGASIVLQVIGLIASLFA